MLLSRGNHYFFHLVNQFSTKCRVEYVAWWARCLSAPGERPMCRVELSRIAAALRAPLNIALALAAGLALVACTGSGISGSDFFASQPAGAAAGRRPDRAGAGQGRAHPAAQRTRQCRRDRAVDAQRRRAGAERIQQSGHPASGEGRRRQRAGRATGGAATDRRGRRDHSRSAVRAFGRAGRAARARPRNSGDRVLDRLQRGGGGRLSPELPAGVRCRAADRLRGAAGQTLVCCRDPGQCLRDGG